MSGSFDKKWQGSDEPSFSKKVVERIRPPAPLKPRLDGAVKMVKNQLTKLDRESTHLGERDKSLFNKVVDSYSKHDNVRAGVYANELAELRKMERMMMNAKLALDQILLRLEAVSELGDVAYTLLPVISVMRDVSHGMAAVNPQIARELGDISNILSGIVLDAGATTGLTINFESTNEDARKIMEEAATVAEGRMKDTFPELPGRISIS